MIEIILAIVIGLVIGVINAAAGTAYGMSKSNIVNGCGDREWGLVIKGEDIIFHEKRDDKKSGW